MSKYLGLESMSRNDGKKETVEQMDREVCVLPSISPNLPMAMKTWPV